MKKKIGPIQKYPGSGPFKAFEFPLFVRKRWLFELVDDPGSEFLGVEILMVMSIYQMKSIASRPLQRLITRLSKLEASCTRRETARISRATESMMNTLLKQESGNSE
ncbi:hypothetical protein V6N13_109432 [Hibiscus sabdariffa]